MIKGLVEQKLTIAGKKYEYPDTTALVGKINELIDAVNNQQTQLNNHGCRLLDLQNRVTALDDPTYHETESEPADPDDNIIYKGE